MSQSEKNKCPSCGASMKSFLHTITPGLVGILIKAIEFVKKNNRNYFHLAKDLDLSKNEYNNAQKLRFHALIAKVEHKSGYWLITKRGGQFLRGEVNIPLRVQTFRNKVKGHSPEIIHIRDLKHKFPEFESEFAFEFQKPVGYEAPVQESLMPEKFETKVFEESDGTRVARRIKIT